MASAVHAILVPLHLKLVLLCGIEMCGSTFLFCGTGIGYIAHLAIGIISLAEERDDQRIVATSNLRVKASDFGIDRPLRGCLHG